MQENLKRAFEAVAAKTIHTAVPEIEPSQEMEENPGGLKGPGPFGSPKRGEPGGFF